MADAASRKTRVRPDAMCPLRAGQPCTLCHPEAHRGPQDCPIVAIVRDDPDLMALLATQRPETAARPAP